MEKKRQLTILFAEDNDGDACLLEERLKEGGLANPVLRFKSGDEAWNFFSGKSEPGFEPGKAYLLVSDIHMPGMDGIELLQRVKADPRLKSIPVIMHTSSEDPADKAVCRELGCSEYLIKHEIFKETVALIKRRVFYTGEGCGVLERPKRDAD